MAGGQSTFATGPSGAASASDGLEAGLATTALSEKTGRAILTAAEAIHWQLDQIRRFAAQVVGEMPSESPLNPSIGA